MTSLVELEHGTGPLAMSGGSTVDGAAHTSTKRLSGLDSAW